MCLKLCVALLNLGGSMVKTGNQPVGKIGGEGGDSVESIQVILIQISKQISKQKRSGFQAGE